MGNIHDHIGDCYRGILSYYSVEESPLGTGCAIKQALDVVWGDKAVVAERCLFGEVDAGLHTFAIEPSKLDVFI